MTNKYMNFQSGKQLFNAIKKESIFSPFGKFALSSPSYLISFFLLWTIFKILFSECWLVSDLEIMVLVPAKEK